MGHETPKIVHQLNRYLMFAGQKGPVRLDPDRWNKLHNWMVKINPDNFYFKDRYFYMYFIGCKIICRN